MIDIKIVKVTQLATNCCYLKDSTTGRLAVVDPGGQSSKLIKMIKSDGEKLDYVILTHGHYDHIGYAKELADKFGAKIVTGRNNSEFLCDTKLNLSNFGGVEIPPFSADILLDDADMFMLGKTPIMYIATPGHTKGCGTYMFDNTLITGDTLFFESYGRTDLPTGDLNVLMSSLQKLRDIRGDFKVIPGHGKPTTLEHERKNNPLMRRI